MPMIDKEKKAASAAKYRNSHKEEIKAKDAIYRETHREEILAKARAYRQSNPEKVRGSREKYYQSHREEVIARSSEWQKKHKEEHAAFVERWEQEHRDQRTDAVKLRRRRLSTAVWEYFGGRCQICGLAVDYPEIYHCHHIDPTVKEFGIATKLAGAWNTKLEEELAKCAFLCANCHSAFHHGRFLGLPLTSGKVNTLNGEGDE